MVAASGDGPRTYDGPYVWNAAELTGVDDWIFPLGEAALAEIDRWLADARARDLAPEGIGPGDVDLPSLRPQLDAIETMLARGRGFALLRGLPVEHYAPLDIARVYCAIGSMLGTAVSQSYKGDRLGRVMDIGEGGRYYTVGGALEMHVDPVDATGLLCLRKAVRGGESLIVSAMAVHNAIAHERPELMATLARGYHYGAREADRAEGGQRLSPEPIPVFDQVGDMPACFFLPISVRHAVRASGVALSATEEDAMAFVNEVAHRPEHCLEMDLAEGDIQFLNNRLILHGRRDYTDAPNPARKREMLRLWLMMPNWVPRPARQNFHGNEDRAGGGIPKTG